MANISGADIRRYRKELDLSQTEFVKRMGITQAALSLIEQGKTAVSEDHVETLRKNFVAPDCDPAFGDFEKRLVEERMSVRLGKVARGDHLTITVWRWEEGMNLTDGLRADQAADLITIRQPKRRVLAFLMPKKSDHWAGDEIIVFEETIATNLKDRDLCLVYRTKPRSGDDQSLIAVAHVLPATRGAHIQYQPISPIGPTFDHNDEHVHQVARVFFRGTYREGQDKN
jgi:transcriptional regulator with XRE-family HTH domain